MPLRRGEGRERLQQARTYVRRLFDRPIQDERKTAREACAIDCYLFDTDGIATPGTILDRSAGGVRIVANAAGAHETTRYLLRLDTGAAYAVENVWRVGCAGGYSLGARVDLRPKPKSHAVRAIRVAWDEHEAAAKSRVGA